MRSLIFLILLLPSLAEAYVELKLSQANAQASITIKLDNNYLSDSVAGTSILPGGICINFSGQEVCNQYAMGHSQNNTSLYYQSQQPDWPIQSGFMFHMNVSNLSTITFQDLANLDDLDWTGFTLFLFEFQITLAGSQDSWQLLVSDTPLATDPINEDPVNEDPVNECLIESSTTCSDIDLTYSDFSGADLSYADFEFVDLSNANLSGVNLSNSNLQVTTFNNADLSNSNFMGADVFSSYFRSANLSSANFSDAEISTCDMSSANANGATFKNVEFSDVNMNNADLSNADLSNVKMNQCFLNNINFSNANLSNADLENCDLIDMNNIYGQLANSTGIKLPVEFFIVNNYIIGSEANLSDADLAEASLSDAELTGTMFLEADLTDADLSGSNLTDSIFTNAILFGANLSNANLTNANLSSSVQMDSQIGLMANGASQHQEVTKHRGKAFKSTASLAIKRTDLRHANLTNANLFGANLNDSDLRNTVMTNLQNFSDASFVGAKYNDQTVFPNDMNPQELGMILDNSTETTIENIPAINGIGLLALGLSMLGLGAVRSRKSH